MKGAEEDTPPRIIGSPVRARLATVSAACEYAAVSRSVLYEEMKLGNLKFIKLGSSRRIELDELDRWIDDKAAEANE